MIVSHFEIRVAIFLIALIGLNIGYSEYISIPMAMLLLMSVVAIRDKSSINVRHSELISIFTCISISIFVVVFYLSSILDKHSLLFQLRELFFLCIVFYLCKKLTVYDKEIKSALYLAAILICMVVIVQAAQIMLGQVISFKVPQSFMMLNYGNSLDNIDEGIGSYRRPTAFFSEPSVVGSILVPILFLAIKDKKKIVIISSVVAILLSRSLFAVVGMAVVFAYCYWKISIKNLMILLGLTIVFFVFFNERIERVFIGDDMSFIWRFTYPLEMIKDKILSFDYYPMTISRIEEMTTNKYFGASVVDTWVLFTPIRLGIVIGVFWILAVIIAIPSGLRSYFIFLTLLSGAPLYHDKAILMIMIYRANKAIMRD